MGVFQIVEEQGTRGPNGAAVIRNITSRIIAIAVLNCFIISNLRTK